MNYFVVRFLRLIILSTILLPIKSPVASAVESLFWSSLKCVCSRLQKQKTKIHSLLQIFDFWIELNSASFFIYYTLITKVVFILSSICRGLEFWSVNHTSIIENSELKVFKYIEYLCEISNIRANSLLGTNVYKTP